MLRSALMVPLLLLGPAHASPEEKAPTLRLLPLREGVRDVLNRKGDREVLLKTDEYLRAKKVGIDLSDITGNPVVAHGIHGGVLFYVFWFDGLDRVGRFYVRRRH